MGFNKHCVGQVPRQITLHQEDRGASEGLRTTTKDDNRGRDRGEIEFHEIPRKTRHTLEHLMHSLTFL